MLRQAQFRVHRKTPSQIATLARQVRHLAEQAFGKFEKFPVIDQIELWGQREDCGSLDRNGAPSGPPGYLVVMDEELPGGLAEFNAQENILVFRQSVWDKASDGDPYCVEIAAHEIGHWACGHSKMHFGSYEWNETVDPECDSEHQANRFRDELLLDGRIISLSDGVASLTSRFGVTESTARRRIYQLIGDRRRK